MHTQYKPDLPGPLRRKPVGVDLTAVAMLIGVIIMIISARCARGQDHIVDATDMIEINSPLDTMHWEDCDSTEFYAALDSSILDGSILTETRGEDHGHWEWREMYIWLGGYVYYYHWHRDWTPQELISYRRAIWRG